MEHAEFRVGESSGGGPPFWRRRAAAAQQPRGGALEWPRGPPQGRLFVQGAALPADRTLQQVLEQLLPPRGLALGALRLGACRLSPRQCADCPLLGSVSELSVEHPKFCLGGDNDSEDDGEQPWREHPSQRRAVVPVMEALLAQLPLLERLGLDADMPEGASLPDCITSRAGLRFLDIGMACSPEDLPPGPYLQGAPGPGWPGQAAACRSEMPRGARPACHAFQRPSALSAMPLCCSH